MKWWLEPDWKQIITAGRDNCLIIVEPCSGRVEHTIDVQDVYPGWGFWELCVRILEDMR